MKIFYLLSWTFPVSIEAAILNVVCENAILAPFTMDEIILARVSFAPFSEYIFSLFAHGMFCFD